MALETNLQLMGRHIADSLELAKPEIFIPGDPQQPVFRAVQYGEPRLVTAWPYLSVQPIEKRRDLREGATRKFRIEFRIDLFLYHGEVADTLSVQEMTHQRAEALDTWFQKDFKWNFVDTTDSTKDKVIFGMVTMVDHPVVVPPGDALWSASRLQLEGLSEEVF